MKKAELFYGVAAVLGTSLFLPTPAWSQPASESATSQPQQSTQAAVLRDAEGEIIVTARRREESLQRVPVAITAFSGEALQTAGVKNLADLTALAPGLRYSSEGEGNASTISLRGLSKVPVGETLPAVVTYFAEVALPSQGVNVPTYDLENIQVLKGPQGTLFGRNTIGGAVLLTPRAPSYDFNGYASLSLGNFEYKRFEGGVTAPLVQDMLAVRVAGQVVRREGYTKDQRGGRSLNELHNESVRGSILLEPIDGLSNTLVLDYFHAEEQPTASIPYKVSPGISIIEGIDVLAEQVTGLPSDYAGAIRAAVARQQAIGPFRVHYALDERRSNRKSFAAVNTTRLNLSDDIVLKNIFGYRKSRVSIITDSVGIPASDLQGPFGPFTILFANLEIRRRLISDELQLQGKSFDGKLDWLVGGIYSEDKPYGPSGSYGPAFQFGPPQILYSSALLGSQNRALFAQIGLDLSDWLIPGLKFNAGYRHSWDKVEACGLGNSTGYVSIAECDRQANLNSPTDGAGIVTAKGDEPTYTLGLDWQVNNRTLLYFAHRKGYRGVNVNAPRFETQFTTGGTGCSIGGAPVQCPDLRPFQTTKAEKIQDFELGAKTQWSLGGIHGRLNMALYQNKITGQVQFLQILPLGVPSTAPDNPQASALGINAADVRNRGFEFEGSLIPTEGVIVTFNGAYNKTKILKINIPPLAGVGIAEGQINRPTPKFTGTLGLEWTLPVRPLDGELVFNALGYKSTSWRPQEGVPLPGYELLDLRLALRNIGESNLDAGIWARNVTNEKYPSAAVVLVPGFPIQSVNYGEPRTFGVDLRYSWGK